jgi:hypothetical protein
VSAVPSTESESDEVSETRAYSHMRSVKTPHATAQTGSSRAHPKVDKERKAGEARAARSKRSAPSSEPAAHAGEM